MADHVDLVVEQWGAQRPGLDVSAMEVIGRLKRLSRLVEADLRRTFAEHGLDPAAFDVLATLRRSGSPDGLTPGELMQAAMVTSGAISQRLERLEARGLVRRGAHASDGRIVQVALTEQGRTLIDQVLPDHLATENRLLSGIAPERRAELAATLRDLLISLGDGVT